MNQHFSPDWSLRARSGGRKYVTPTERQRFLQTAQTCPDRRVGLFCLLLVYSGCRLSEALAVTASSLDAAEGCIAIRSLKKRGSVVVREVPIPTTLIHELLALQVMDDADRIWPWSRTHAWKQVKAIMSAASISAGPHASPKGLRHGFGVHAIRSGVPLNLVQRWLGHASLSTTAIYANVLGPEEREIAGRMW
ncbi:tyrosine-type recombinase/integrase [Devosia sp.]|uniref:tyrosine-type recombinase/integrase n=1 Tax=Devosia sp. TaxID=1871048 RepID=UPI003A94BA12